MVAEPCILKIGGSVITEKAASQPRLNEDALFRIAEEIASVGPDHWPAVLVHGAGSYGHVIVARTRFCEHLEDRRALVDWGETQRLQSELSNSVVAALLERGVPAIPVQASAVAILEGGRVADFHVRVIEEYVRRGLVPVLGGVPAVDLVEGCSILSGDVIAPSTAWRLGIRRVLFGTDVPGVFDADPRSNVRARLIRVVHPGNWEEIRPALAGSGATDVTGGMAGKVSGLLEWARRGIESLIFDATAPGAVAAALRGERAGTRVTGRVPD